MFNFYTYEKNLLKQRDEEYHQLKETYERERRKEKNQKLVENYNKRINKFVLEMAATPHVIQDYLNPVESSRLQLMNETNSKIEGRKGFIFKGFITEKERIKQYLEERKKCYDDSKYEKKTKKEEKFAYVQPKMRFKPRTDLERIVEVINEYNFGRVSDDAVKKQLKSLDLNYMKKINGSESNSEDESVAEPQKITEVKRAHESTKTIKEILVEKERQERIAKKEEAIINAHSDAKNKNANATSKMQKGHNSKRKLVDNSGAKALMKEYHFKTHFKAASVLANKCNPSDKKTAQILPQMPETTPSTLKMSRTCANFKSKALHSHDLSDQHPSNFDDQEDNLMEKFAKKFPLDQENFDIIEANPLLYNLNLNPYQRNDGEECDEEKLAYLKRISENVKQRSTAAFPTGTISKHRGAKIFRTLKLASRKSNSLIGNSPIEFLKDEEASGYEFKKEEDRIWVDNEAIPKTKVDLIAKKILKNCNYTHQKSKSNPKMLKKGEGKLMITSGMTVQEFMKKMKNI